MANEHDEGMKAPVAETKPADAGPPPLGPAPGSDRSGPREFFMAFAANVLIYFGVAIFLSLLRAGGIFLPS